MPPFINRFLLLLSRGFRRIYIFVRLDSQRRTRRANHLKMVYRKKRGDLVLNWYERRRDGGAVQLVDE